MALPLRPAQPRRHAHPVPAVALAVGLSLAAGVLFLIAADRSRWLAAALLVAALCVGAGWILGEKLWPWLGRATAIYALRGYVWWARRKGARLVIATDADFEAGRLRETWESMAYAMALAVLSGAVILVVTHGEREELPWLSLGALALCAATTFILVPHWAFARLGLRVWEVRRFVVVSLADSYGHWLRLSNGTLLAVALAYSYKLVADASPRADSLSTMMLSFVGLLAVSVALFGTAVAYFHRRETEVVHAIGVEARRLGFAPVHPDALRARP